MRFPKRAAGRNGGHHASAAMSQTHCLIADDSDVIRRITKLMLTALRLDSSEAVNGHDAIDRCRKAMPDAIILDWIMPGLAGLEALQALRRLPGGAAPAILYCVTENSPEETARALQAGATDILLKPYDRETLRQKLTSAGLI